MLQDLTQHSSQAVRMNAKEALDAYKGKRLVSRRKRQLLCNLSHSLAASLKSK